MAELLILEFEGVGEAEYMRVNDALGIDMSTDEGDWPPGIIEHMAAPTSDGWIVVELWETREDQDEFLKTRLGPALQQGGNQASQAGRVVDGEVDPRTAPALCKKAVNT